jgi:hypothetical protein
VRCPVRRVEDGEVWVAFGDGDEEIDKELWFELVGEGDDVEEVCGCDVAEVL